MPGHSHRVAPEYDPELAARLLAEAGYAEGKGLPEIALAAPKWIAGDARELAEQWEALGARITVTRLPLPLDRVTLADHHIWINGWAADYPVPDGFFRGLLAEDQPFHVDEEILDLLAEARSLRDQAERMRLYQEIDRLWVRERAAILPLIYSRTLLLRRPWVQGLWTNPLVKAHLDEVVITRPAPGGSGVPIPDQA